MGSYIISGFAEDDQITLARDEDAYTKRVGVAGEVTRIKNTNRAGSVTVSLMQSSLSNDELSFLAELDEFANFGAVPLLLKDHNGRALVASPFCWVRRYPELQWKKDVAVWKWTLDTVTLSMYAGGINGT